MNKIYLTGLVMILVLMIPNAEAITDAHKFTIIKEFNLGQALYENIYLRNQLGMPLYEITPENVIWRGFNALGENPVLRNILNTMCIRKVESSSGGSSGGHGDWYPPEERDGYVKPYVEPEVIVGDADGNGGVEPTDMSKLILCVQGIIPFETAFDLSGELGEPNGVCDSYDVIALQEILNGN